MTVVESTVRVNNRKILWIILHILIGIASTYPEPEDKLAFIEAQLYDYNYDNKSALPELYEWPDQQSTEWAGIPRKHSSDGPLLNFLWNKLLITWNP